MTPKRRRRRTNAEIATEAIRRTERREALLHGAGTVAHWARRTAGTALQARMMESAKGETP